MLAQAGVLRPCLQGTVECRHINILAAYVTVVHRRSQEAADQLQTSEVTAANSSKFRSGQNVLFNMEETPNSAKVVQGSAGDSRNGGNGKRTVIDLDEYDEKDQKPKRGKNELVQVRIEPEE